MEWLPQVGVEGVYSSSSRTGDEFYDMRARTCLVSYFSYSDAVAVLLTLILY